MEQIRCSSLFQDTINYSQLAKVVVQSHHQYLTLHFEGAADPWTCWSDDHTNVVRVSYANVVRATPLSCCRASHTTVVRVSHIPVGHTTLTVCHSEVHAIQKYHSLSFSLPSCPSTQPPHAQPPSRPSPCPP